VATAPSDFPAALRATAARIEAALAGFLPTGDIRLAQAMRHAVLSGGKRLRGFLALESAALHGAADGPAMASAAAVECVHAYSLVHDDLPCMDDDALRRGQPTVHVRWDEATAVLAGDALQSLAFEILAAPRPDAEPRAQLRLLHTLAAAAGEAGMAGGQALDIEAETAAAPLGLETVSRLQALKTGALIGWAAEAGAILGGADPAPMRRYAGDLGLAFQIRDDILDVEGVAGQTGKRVGKDMDRNKATFVSLLGLEGARREARGLAARACDALDPYGATAERLRRLARFAVERTA
jgi:farnesyl diphosphate synthase